ncbi:MAG: hypothetical protein JO318_09395 [Chloroflexi bacterium]|nr:hypothetical protein [Chloroflexota bacterium]
MTWSASILLAAARRAAGKYAEQANCVAQLLACPTGDLGTGVKPELAEDVANVDTHGASVITTVSALTGRLGVHNRSVHEFGIACGVPGFAYTTVSRTVSEQGALLSPGMPRGVRNLAIGLVSPVVSRRLTWQLSGLAYR